MTARAINPNQPGFAPVDGSTAKPADADRNPRPEEGKVGSDYLNQCRADNPEPDGNGKTDSVTLSNCKITTAPEKLATDQPFEMSVEAKGPDGTAPGTVTFNLFCTLPDADGGEDCQDQSSPFQASVANGVATAKGTLVSPKTPVDSGTRLKYHVVAEHPGSTRRSESPKLEVEAGTVPKPLAIWTLGAVHFGFDSSFVLPSALDAISGLKDRISRNPKAAVAVFGHADPVGEDDYNKSLSGRRAYAVFCLLARKTDGWKELAKGTDGDKWDHRATQTMLAHLKDASGKPYYAGSIDGKPGPRTEAGIQGFQKDNGLKVDGKTGTDTDAKLFGKYMDGICEVSLPEDAFVGDPKDAKRQWACVGCGELNPVLVFSKAEADGFGKSGDKAARNARNAPNRRATVMLFPESIKGPGRVVFPCPAWSDGSDACRKQSFADSDKRRNPSDSPRTWEKDKDTFACRFYARISSETDSGSAGFIEVRLVDSSDAPLADLPYRLTFSDGSFLEGKSDTDGFVRHPDKRCEGSFKLVLNPPAV